MCSGLCELFMNNFRGPSRPTSKRLVLSFLMSSHCGKFKKKKVTWFIYGGLNCVLKTFREFLITPVLVDCGTFCKKEKNTVSFRMGLILYDNKFGHFLSEHFV